MLPGVIRPHLGYHLRVAGSEVTNLIVQLPIRRGVSVGGAKTEALARSRDGDDRTPEQSHNAALSFFGHGEPRDEPVVRRGPACPPLKSPPGGAVFLLNHRRPSQAPSRCLHPSARPVAPPMTPGTDACNHRGHRLIHCRDLRACRKSYRSITIAERAAAGRAYCFRLTIGQQ